jgi:hypothetical protein
MNRMMGWLVVLLPLVRCACHNADRCPCWPDSYVGRFRSRPLSPEELALN